MLQLFCGLAKKVRLISREIIFAEFQPTPVYDHDTSTLQTDRRTNGQLNCLGNTALRYASRGKNWSAFAKIIIKIIVHFFMHHGICIGMDQKKTTHFVIFYAFAVKPPWTDLHEIWHRGSPRGHNQPCQIFRRSVQGVSNRFCGGRISPVSIDLRCRH